MTRRSIPSRLLAGLVLAAGLSAPAHAALQGRDLNGSVGSFEAYYDTDLNITWLADANYAKTSGYDADGLMTWSQANTWAAQLSFYNPLTNETIDNWRLPTTTDTGAADCNFAYSGTDCGYNVDPASSEMAHLFFTELGNISAYNTSGAFVGGSSGVNWGLVNKGPFTNFQSGYYWSGTEYAPSPSGAWLFGTGDGFQFLDGKSDSLYALAVRPGDVAAVPEAQTYALMLAGLGLIGWRARRRG